MKRLLTLLCLVMVVLTVSFTAPNTAVRASEAPSETIITLAEDFTSTDAEPQYDGFETVITSNGNQYELTDIRYKRNSSTDKTTTRRKTTTRTKTGLISKSYSVGETETIVVSGKEYVATIKNVSYETVRLGDRWGEVSGSKDYGLQTEKPTVPETMNLSYFDKETGKSFSVDAPLTSLEKSFSEWQDYSYIEIEIINYTDSKYMFNGHVINNDGETVLPEIYYSELLALAGMNDENHRISTVNWIGDAYKSGSVKSRKARANIQAYCAAYTAYYYKKFALDDTINYKATITYEYDLPAEVIETVYTYTATATYTLIEQAPEETMTSTESPTEESTVEASPDEAAVKKEIVVKTITTLSLLLILCLGFVILVMFLMTKFKLRK